MKPYHELTRLGLLRRLRLLARTALQAYGLAEARLTFQQYSANWLPPAGFERFIWDWEGQFGER
jgi:hypothetical protein